MRKMKQSKAVVLAAPVLFIPSCVGVMMVVDQFRYGRSDYASVAEIPDDGYIELPPQAVDIVLYRHGGGHYARFSISSDSLRSWVDQMRSLRADLNESGADPWRGPMADFASDESLDLSRSVFAQQFPDTGWSYDPRMIEATVTRSDRGGGYTIWHLPENELTYLRAGYW